MEESHARFMASKVCVDTLIPALMQSHELRSIHSSDQGGSG